MDVRGSRARPEGGFAFGSGGAAMKLSYHPETDSLYIDLLDRSGVESREISDGVVLDYDAAGSLVGIDIDRASVKIDLTQLVLGRMPGRIETTPA